MIRAYYTQAQAQIMESGAWNEHYPRFLAKLSESRRQRLLRIKHQQSRLNSALGLSLLQHAMVLAGHTDFRLDELLHTEQEKPACPGRHPFNISHSKEVVICVINQGSNDPVGIDVELVRQMEAEKFYEYISAAELESAINQEEPFIHCWTQKEAVIKAEGNGGVWDAGKVKLMGDRAEYLGKLWHLVELTVPESYIAHLAYSEAQSEISCTEIAVEQLLNNTIHSI